MKKQKILIATANPGKIKEIKEIFNGLNYQLYFLSDFKKKITINENAKSFEGNALIKAIVAGDEYDMLTLGDDSGLCVDALGGRPGVMSARYSKEETTEGNIKRVLKEMQGFPTSKRACRYDCTVAIYDPKSKFIQTVEGNFEGRITKKPKGDQSFGYAPIFAVKHYGYKKMNAELGHDKLIKINHRGQAFRKAITVLNKFYKTNGCH